MEPPSSGQSTLDRNFSSSLRENKDLCLFCYFQKQNRKEFRFHHKLEILNWLATKLSYFKYFSLKLKGLIRDKRPSSPFSSLVQTKNVCNRVSR